MAIARCDKCGTPQGKTLKYVQFHKLEGGDRIICGALNCTRPASLIWLTEEEEEQYLQGERNFAVHYRRGRVLVK